MANSVSRYLMPGLFLMLIGLVVYAAVRGDMARALDFLFGFHDMTLTPAIFMEAVGQAFFHPLCRGWWHHDLRLLYGG